VSFRVEPEAGSIDIEQTIASGATLAISEFSLA
jgi:hypothetical protein